MSTALRVARTAAILIALFAVGAFAQAPAQINFDGLPRRTPPTKPAVRTDTGSAKLRAARMAAQRDSIAKLRKSVRVDTVQVTRVDTLRVTFTDTVKIVTGASHPAAPAPVAAPVVISPTFTANGLTQVMFTAGDGVKSTYRMRRVEVKMTADLGNKAQAVMMVDAAKSLSLNTSGAQPAVNQSSRILQDAYITMPVRRLTIDAGQQRLPLGSEGSMGASSLETVDRALMESDKARSASFGDVRDAGVAVKQAFGTFDYRVGVFNGSGETMNDVDKQVAKAVVGQLVFHPKFLAGLRVGVSGATSGAASGDNPTRDRAGMDVRYLRGPVAVQMEAMKGQDGTTRRLGRYALATYEPRKGFRLVTRVDVYDPDLATDVYPTTVGECDYLGGFTWLPAGTRLKLQLNAVHKTFTAGLGPSSNVVLSQLQASW